MSENVKANNDNNEENDSPELTQEECDLYDYFINEYNDLFENALNLRGKNLYSIIKNNVFQLIGKTNLNKYSKTSLKKVYYKLKEEYFEPDNIVIKYLEENLDTIDEDDLPILNIDSIFAHCNKCYESTHICGEPLYNYKYYDLIICIKCRMIYKKNMIRLFCNSCNEEYYSYIVSESNYKKDFFPATWEKYHCFTFNHDQMTCPECASPLYYSELKKLLKCFKCNWTSNPRKILWECEVCGEKFSSKIKEFIKYETKPEINCVKYALINRIDAKPYMCKCCGENPININFFHPDCNGGYFLSYLQTKFAVVCNKCKIIQKPEQVKWGCGKCKKNFFCDKMIVLESAIEKEKNFGRNAGCKENPKKLYSEKNVKRFLSMNNGLKGKCPTNQKNNTNHKNDGINEVRSEKIHYKTKNKIAAEKNKDNINSNVKKNLGKSLKAIGNNENSYKSRFEKISQDFERNKIANSLEFRTLKKNVSDNKIDFKSYNRRKLDLQSNLTKEKPTKKENNDDNINKKEKEKNISIEKEKSQENENNIIENIKSETKIKRVRKIKKANTKKMGKFKPTSEKNLNRFNIKNFPLSPIEPIKEYPETNVKLRNNNNAPSKYNRIKKNQNIEVSSFRETSQKKSKNIRLNFNLNININNIVENNNNNDNLNSNNFFSIKTENLLEPEENFNPDEFKLIEKIGFGSFGKIYKVRWLRNNENYALKILNLRHLEDIDDSQKKLKIMKDFYNETKSPGVIRTYGNVFVKIGKGAYTYYILMELAQTDWEREINSRNKKHLYYTQTELFDIIKQLITLYSLLQKNNISHRDVKPQNILIINGLYKICDFGEARNISGKNGYIHQPIRGSELYMSPILFDALNNDQLDVLHNSYKSDAFSLGMCIFFAATLSYDCLYEIREEKNMMKIKKILEKYLIPRYSEELVNILYSMLQVDEELRPNFIELEKLYFPK